MMRLLLPAMLVLAGCQPEKPTGPIAVSVIGAAPALADADRVVLNEADAVLIGATAQGLIRFDAAAQIEPGLAIRWDVSDDGLFYTFRLADDASIDAEAAARRLRAAIARTSRNALKPVLGAISEVVAVTPEVIEIRLSAPRPNLLQLLAQPELAIRDPRTRAGTGPFRRIATTDRSILLEPVDIAAEEDAEARSLRHVRLRGERTGLAVARFKAGGADAVLGGRFADLAIAQAAQPATTMLRFDPAPGLFGLAFTRISPFLAAPEVRRALAMAIDRERLTAAFAAPGWQPAVTIAPLAISDLPSPARPDWADTPIDRRRALAGQSIASWIAANGDPAPLRIALPAGPGARLLMANIQADWRRIGVQVEAVADDAEADLRLVDAVAPADIGSWYLRQFICERSPICNEATDLILANARAAPTLLERNLLLAEADQRLAQATAFIPIASPLRWSLVRPALSGWRDNPRARHPLNHLRPEPR